MDKRISIKKGQEIIRKFLELHKVNSSPYHHNNEYLVLEHLDCLKDVCENEQYFAILKSVLINHLETKYSEDKLSVRKERKINMETKKIEPEKYQYAYGGEKARFNEIEKSWRERDYRDIIDECDTLLGHFVKNLHEVKTGKEFSFTDKKKDQEIEVILKEITSSRELSELKGI
ncbi:3891_t:CDS:2 [Ambispora gerdemannii]|uniref:3891_t:CDS:1 n=1 Tax=Ambispora gerdemannii TaxID=144530 RepID=A0A9N8YWW1_9GLOM|nr:3891_t:CDS:2 [Ambispora gerdemannii]